MLTFLSQHFCLFVPGQVLNNAKKTKESQEADEKYESDKTISISFFYRQEFTS